MKNKPYEIFKNSDDALEISLKYHKPKNKK